MPANGLTTGIDSKITFSDADGVRQFAILESFHSSENADAPEKVAMDGSTRFPKFHKGWKGSFTFQRTSDVLDRYIALQESEFYGGIDQLPGTITQTITNVDGSVSQYSFSNVVLILENAGDYTGTDIVTQTFSWMASRKQQLA